MELILTKPEKDLIKAKRWWSEKDIFFKFLLIAAVFGFLAEESVNNIRDDQLIMLHKSWK